MMALVGLLASGGCKDRTLVAVEDATLRNVDDRVDVEANFCTRPIEETTFPVKLLLVVDGSGSLQFTDQSALRRIAVRDLMTSLSTQNDVFVSTMVFGSNIYVDPPITPGSPGFIPASEWVEPSFLGQADVTTNYQGAMGAIQSHLLMDMLASDPAELARSKYVIIFFSDGAPSPICCLAAEENTTEIGEMPFGCQPEPWEVFVEGRTYCDGASEIAVCNQQNFLDNFNDVNSSDFTPDYGDGTLAALEGLEPGDNYNRVYQIENQVAEIVELGETFEVGELRLHTALLYDDTLPPAIKELARVNRCRSEGLLRSMAEIGGGVYRDFENGEDIDFLSFNFTALKRGYGLVSTLALNENALPRENDQGAFVWAPDSDADGLTDDFEFELGTAPNVRDSDRLVQPPAATDVPDPLPRESWGDGYSDAIENAFSDVGYDARYQSLPSRGCPGFSNDGVDTDDRDFDGLNGCEEFLYGSDITRADTDGDGLPDELEVRYGLDPSVSDLGLDEDFDGETNVDEVRKGTNPRIPNASGGEALARRYELIERPSLEDGRRCYTARVSGVRLVETEPQIEGGRRGYNTIGFWLAEAPEDNPTGRTELRYACYRAQYAPPSFKDPAQGEIVFEDEDFIDFDDPEDLARLAAGEDICGGRPIQ